MQHRMTEISIIGHESCKNSDAESPEQFPACVSSMQNSHGAAGSKYKVKRVLYHHGYNINPKRGKNWDYRTGGEFAGYYNHRDKMNRIRAIAVACLGFFLVFLILWLVARNRNSML